MRGICSHQKIHAVTRSVIDLAKTETGFLSAFQGRVLEFSAID